VQRENPRPLVVTPARDQVDSAFGLSLRSAFSLPGAEPGGIPDRSLPACVLELASEGDLLTGWSGPVSPSAWKGALKDGSELAIEWGVEHDLLFRYGSRALFRLNPAATRLACAPRDVVSISWRRVLCSRVLPLVAIARGREALHAAAVETPAGVVALAGPSGSGKSTLAAALVARGHRLFTDDVLVISAEGKKILAHPGGPYLSLADGPVAPPPGEILDSVGDKHWIAMKEVAERPREVAAIILLERGGATSPEVSAIPASPLPLAPFMLGLPDEPDRDRSRFSTYSDLVGDAALLRLRAAGEDSAADLASELERALGLTAAIRGAA
jgi:hypothetical protein